MIKKSAHLRLGMVVTLTLWPLNSLRSQTLQIEPLRIATDQEPSIRLSGVAPHQLVTLHADLKDGAGNQWQSAADFVADESGVIDPATQAPIRGSYTIISAAGLIWSMMPAVKGAKAYQAFSDLAPQMIHFNATIEGKEVAHSELQQIALEGVRRVNLRGAIHGVVLIPRSEGRHPGLLVLGGSEGGLPLGKAAWLASHGYVALALAYFHYENLPTNLEQIPLEYFGQALTFLSLRPEVVSNKIGVVGTSRGAELALQLGSMYPQIKTIVAYAPADTRHPACCERRSMLPAWTWQGRPLAFASGHPSESRIADPITFIQVEKINGDVLLISGSDDGIWSARTMADAVMQRLRNAHFAYRSMHFNYTDAGHRAGKPGIAPVWTGGITQDDGRPMRFGGTVAGNALSGLDAAPKTLDFIAESFRTQSH